MGYVRDQIETSDKICITLMQVDSSRMNTKEGRFGFYGLQHLSRIGIYQGIVNR